ncbi:MAG: T9SS type A sorting domain-containing protein [Candidatus Eisenbacteria bacterium]
MSARCTLARAALLVACSLLPLMLLPERGRAQCPTLYGATGDAAYPLTASPTAYLFDQELPYWSVIGTLTNSPTLSDWDLEIYSTENFLPPTCFTGLLANSNYVAGYADFVVGDFNSNPYGNYYARAFCYGGDCSPGFQALFSWRPGGHVLTVDAPAIVQEIPTNDYADQVAGVYDVYLNSGEKYWLRFSSTGDLQTQMFLFRNPTGGVYWAGRSSAVVASSGCSIYTAPSTGWYGVVIANDRRAGTQASYTLGVYTSPNCGCPANLAYGVPVHTPPPDDTPAYYRDPDFPYYWQTTAVRGTTADWDISAGEQVSSGPSEFCMQTTDASSTYGTGITDFVVGVDSTASAARDTLAVRVFRYSGAGDAVVERQLATSYLSYNDPVVIRNLSPEDITDIMQLPEYPGYDWQFEVTPYSSDVHVMSFGPDNGAPYLTGRVNGQSVVTGTVLPATSIGTAAIVAVKDNLSPDAYAIRGGGCFGAFDWPDSTVYGLPAGLSWFRLPASGHRWTAYTAVSPTSDWDLDQFFHSIGGTWPVCLSSPGASSGGVGVADMLVGDLRYSTDDSVFVRAKQFTSGYQVMPYCQWRPQAVPLVVNAPPVGRGTDATTNILQLYEVTLLAGTNYSLRFSRSGAADTHLLLFGNPGSSEYWSPRSGRLLDVTATTTYTPLKTDTYAIAIVNENLQAGTYLTAVSSSPTGVADAVPGPGRPRITSVSPNPGSGSVSIAFSAEASDPVGLEIFDIRGRHVATLDASRLGTQATTRWSGLDDRGQTVADGVYLLRMSEGGRTVEMRKLVRVR